MLNLFKINLELKTASNLYSFQCGRNRMNKTMCLLGGQFLCWNSRCSSQRPALSFLVFSPIHISLPEFGYPAFFYITKGTS